MKITSHLFRAPNLWPDDELHTRRADWSELFFDLVFAATISQLGSQLIADYSLHGVMRYAFSLALVFLAWLGYTTFSTQFFLDDVFQRALIIAQIFLVAVMAANSTSPLNSQDAAGFGAAYGGIRLILALQYLRVVSLTATRRIVIRRIVGLVFAAGVWSGSAFLPVPYRYFAWTGALMIDVWNSWLPGRGTVSSPPGATHFPERFGLMTIILLGEFVASVLLGIQSQVGWNIPAASAAILSVALAFAIWSCYSDGANAWEIRHVQNRRDVVLMRMWVALHFLLYLGIGIIAIGARRGIALMQGAFFSTNDERLICSATTGLVIVIMGIAATSHRRGKDKKLRLWFAQMSIAIFMIGLPSIAPRIPASALLFMILLCFTVQTFLLTVNQGVRRTSEEV